MLKKKHRIVEGVYFSRYLLYKDKESTPCNLCKFKIHCYNISLNDKSLYQLCLYSTIIERDLDNCDITYWPDPKKYTIIHDKKLKKIE